MRLRHLILLVLLSQTTAAYNYTQLPELNLTIEKPAYGVVWDYNLEQSKSIDEPPLEIKLINAVPFKDAWIKIMAVDKAVQENVTGLDAASREGLLLVKYDYVPVCPNSTPYDWDECTGRKYRLVNSTEELRIYANGRHQGNQTIQNYSVPEEEDYVDLRAELRLEAACRMRRLRHYWENGSEYCDETEPVIRHYYGTIRDQILYGVADIQPETNLTWAHLATDKLDASKGSITIRSDKEYVKLSLRFGGKNLTYAGNAYDYESYLPDYNLIRITTYPLPHIIESNMFSRITEQRNNATGEVTVTINFTLTYNETLEILTLRKCNLTVTDFFGGNYSLREFCQVNLSQTKIEASTDEKIYAVGDEINVWVRLTADGKPLPAREVKAYYAGKEFLGFTDGNGETEFTIKAEHNFNTIKLEFISEDRYIGSAKTLLIATTGSQLEALILQVLPALLVLLISAYGAYMMLKFAGVLR